MEYVEQSISSTKNAAVQIKDSAITVFHLRPKTSLPTRQLFLGSLSACILKKCARFRDAFDYRAN
jgi:hypothetical protein